MPQKKIKAYKVFHPDWTCRGFQFEVGKTYKHTGYIAMCSSGFHACTNLAHCFSYYSFDPQNKVAEVEISGDTQTHDEDSKIVGRNIKIIRELMWQEVLEAANTGANNSGFGNSGDRNSGNWNSGNQNSGDRNSGDQNSGNQNSGDRNSGDQNSGDRNSGDQNSGNWNSGNQNSGYRNSGDRNSGDQNSGYRNSGNQNSGYRNSGNWNSGDRNSGDQNSGYRNSGAFCTDDNPDVLIFDKPSGIKVRDWERSEAVQLMERNLETHIWIDASEMSEKEKEAYPNWETRDGYLKHISLKDAWLNMWNNLTDTSKAVFTSLPNFDKTKFLSITGIDVEAKK